MTTNVPMQLSHFDVGFECVGCHALTYGNSANKHTHSGYEPYYGQAFIFYTSNYFTWVLFELRAQICRLQKSSGVLAFENYFNYLIHSTFISPFFFCKFKINEYLLSIFYFILLSGCCKKPLKLK